jgi:hypothetical protein
VMLEKSIMMKITIKPLNIVDKKCSPIFHQRRPKDN